MSNGGFYNDSFDENGMEADYAQALEKYKSACKQGKEYSVELLEDEFLYIIDYYINENKEEEVLKACEIAFSHYSYSCELLVKLADSLILTGNSQKAKELLNKYKDSFPQSADIALLYCRLHINAGEYESARDSFAMVVAYEQESSCVVEAATSLSQDCIDNENYIEAIYYLTEADKIEPLSFEYYNDFAFCYERLDNLNKAENYYNLYLNKDPFNDNVWFNLGTVYARQLNFSKAVEAFEYAIALNASNSSALYNLAVVCLNLEKYKESVKYFNEFNICEPNNLSGLLGLANAYMGDYKFATAIETFMQVIKIDSNCNEAKLGIEASHAMDAYLKGEKSTFYLIIDYIIKADVSWINTMRRVIPQLNNDMEFINHLQSKIN